MGEYRIAIPEERIVEFCRRNHVRSLALFGSALREDFPDSDVDLLVEFEPAARFGFLALSRMQRELSDLLGRTVDLVLRDGLSRQCARRCCPPLRCCMRREVLYLCDTVEAADATARFLEGVDRDNLLSDELRRSPSLSPTTPPRYRVIRYLQVSIAYAMIRLSENTSG